MTKEEVYDKMEPLSQKEKDIICSTLFYCINWFIEVGYCICFVVNSKAQKADDKIYICNISKQN